MTYREWERLHAMAERGKAKRRRKNARLRAQYYLLQKLYAIYLAMFGVILMIVGKFTTLCWLQYVAVVWLIFSCYVAITKRKILVTEWSESTKHKK